MSDQTFTAVDLSRLPAPQVVETLSFETILGDMLADLRARDARDAARAAAPLFAAPDAVVIDTTVLSIAEAAGQALDLVVLRLAAGGA